jgi:predicted secreted protein
MPTQAIAATGVILNFNVSPVPEITNISDLGGNATLVDVTAHDTVGGWSARIPTFLDGGTVRVDANYVPGNAVHQALYTAFLARTSTLCSVVLPDASTTTFVFSAFVTAYRVPTMPVNGVLPLHFELTTDGAVTIS